MKDQQTTWFEALVNAVKELNGILDMLNDIDNHDGVILIICRRCYFYLQ